MSPLRKTIEKRNSPEPNAIESGNKSESVKNLIEEVKNTLKSIESESSSSKLTYPEIFSSPSYANWQNHVFEFDNTGNEFLRHCPERASTGKIKNSHSDFPTHSKYGAKSATTLANLKEYEKQLLTSGKSDSKKLLLLGSDKTLNETHKRAFKAAGGKILHKKDSKSSHSSKEGINKLNNSNLRIRIAKSPVVTDSSNEYETETGIPKSPTLFISGVSISRTPEPCTPSATTKDKKSPEHKTRKISPILLNLSNLQNKNNSSPILNFIPASIEIGNDENGINFPAIEGNLFPPDQFNDKYLNCGRQSRSSSLTVPRPNAQDDSEKKNLNVSCGAILSPYCDKKINTRKGSNHVLSLTPPRNSIVTLGQNNKKNNIENEISAKDNEGVFNFGICNHKEIKSSAIHEPYNKKTHGFFKSNNQNVDLIRSESLNQEMEDNNKSDDENKGEMLKKSGKSKSASEPEREREMFRFPKSSTDGALSSVLHVQESNLSSDDFHEVLFLLERSPKHGSKRKKKSKKERDKAKENLNKDECNEVSSAL